jgi:hypothetical protein
MSTDIQTCHRCGRIAAKGEDFTPQRAKRAPPNRVTDPEAVLCPACAADQPQALLNYQFCDQCNGPIEPGQSQVRWRSDTRMMGAVANHRSVPMTLCPICVKSHDGTGRSLIIYVLVMFGLLAAAATVTWLWDHSH